MTTARARRPLAAVLLLACLAGGGVAAAKSGHPAPPPGFSFEPKDAAAARHLEREHAAIDLINRANRRVWSRRPSCRPSIERPATTTTHDTPSQPVLDAIAALRRPALAVDQPETGQPGHLGFGEVYVDYVRSATAVGGRQFWIVVARRVQPGFHPSAACLDAQHAELVRLVSGQDHKLRSTALEIFSHLRHGQETAPPPATPQDGIYLFTRATHGVGGGGGGGDIASFRERGNFISMGGGSASTLDGVVPDGVATVTLEYPRVVTHGRYFKPTIYPSAYRRTVRVQQNVLSVRVPRDAGGAFPHRMVWRDAAGVVLRVVRKP